MTRNHWLSKYRGKQIRFSLVVAKESISEWIHLYLDKDVFLTDTMVVMEIPEKFENYQAISVEVLYKNKEIYSFTMPDDTYLGNVTQVSLDFSQCNSLLNQVNP